MCESRQFCQRGSNSTLKTFFFPSVILVRIQIPLKVGTIIMGCWRGSFVIFQGIRTSIAKKNYIFMVFQGVPDPLPPPLWIRPCQYGPRREKPCFLLWQLGNAQLSLHSDYLQFRKKGIHEVPFQRENIQQRRRSACAYAQSVLHEKTVPMHRLICAFVVRMQQNQG